MVMLSESSCATAMVTIPSYAINMTSFSHISIVEKEQIDKCGNGIADPAYCKGRIFHVK